MYNKGQQGRHVRCYLVLNWKRERINTSLFLYLFIYQSNNIEYLSIENNSNSMVLLVTNAAVASSADLSIMIYYKKRIFIW